MITLTELFLPQTGQEFPPPHVYAYIDGEVKSLSVKQLPEYETMYAFEGNYDTNHLSIHWNNPKKKFSLPILVPKC